MELLAEGWRWLYCFQHQQAACGSSSQESALS
jgi:hypothetical protein